MLNGVCGGSGTSAGAPWHHADIPSKPLIQEPSIQQHASPLTFSFFFFFHSVTFHHVNFQPMAPATFSRCHLSAVAPFYLNLIFPHQRDDLHIWVELAVVHGWKSCVENVYTFDYIACAYIPTGTPDVATAVCSPVAAFAKVELIWLFWKKISQCLFGAVKLISCTAIVYSAQEPFVPASGERWYGGPIICLVKCESCWFFSPIVGFFYPISCLLREKLNTEATAVVLIRSDAATRSKCAPCRF